MARGRHRLDRQSRPAHYAAGAPGGTGTWTIVSGQGDYIGDLSGTKRPVKAGDVAVARAGEVHGVHNSGAVPLVFIPVVAPVEAGYHVA